MVQDLSGYEPKKLYSQYLERKEVIESYEQDMRSIIETYKDGSLDPSMRTYKNLVDQQKATRRKVLNNS